MRSFLIEEKLEKELEKSAKRDKVLYEAIIKKMEEILNCPDINHYKNLKTPLQEFKRVHVRSSFVLLFKYNISEDKIIFYDLDHHDYIYR
jgi:YafQ family addiction module toxin component